MIRTENLTSMLVTPVVFEDVPIGPLTHYIDRPHRFHDDEQMIARALADLGAIAIENAGLYGQVFDSEESMRKQRLTTLGTLAAEIAHEIRNPLMVVRLLFDSLKLSEEKDDNKSKDLSVIREKLNHLEQIAGRILEFGKSRESFRKVTRVQEILEDAVLLVRLKLEQSQVNLIWNDDFKGEKVFVDKEQIQRVLLNLILNALEVMPNGGGVIDSEFVEGWANIYVRDQGQGITEDLRERIFESFLTGRKDGTGLGLSIPKELCVLTMVIWSWSKRQKAPFKISLPLSASIACQKIRYCFVVVFSLV